MFPVTVNVLAKAKSCHKTAPRALAIALEEQTSFPGEVKPPPPWASPAPPPAKVRRTREELVKFSLARQGPPHPECRPEALGAGPRAGSAEGLAGVAARAARTPLTLRGARLPFLPTWRCRNPPPARRAPPPSPPLLRRLCRPVSGPGNLPPAENKAPPARRGAARWPWRPAGPVAPAEPAPGAARLVLAFRRGQTETEAR